MTKQIFSFILAMLMFLSVVGMAACTVEESWGEDYDFDDADEDEDADDEDDDDRKDTEDDDDREDTEDASAASRPIYESQSVETYNPTETAEEYVEDIKDTNDFDGHEFTFLNSAAIYYMYIYLDPDMTGDVLDDCCFERNLLAEEKFNITISEETQPYGDLASYAKTLIYADEDIYDVMYIPARSLTPLISENLFYDLLEIDELNIDRVWWDQPLIKRNIIEDRLFYATSDLNLMAFEGIWCMYFNEDLMKDLGLDMPFQLALDGKWTFDAFKKYCSAAANLNGDSSYVFNVNGNARYGLVNFGNASYMAYGMGAEYASRNANGRYHFTADTDPHFTSVWDSLIDFYGPDNGMQLTASATDLAADVTSQYLSRAELSSSMQSLRAQPCSASGMVTLV